MATFLSLPAEIRDHIYSYILHPSSIPQGQVYDFHYYNYKPALQLLLVNRQTHEEARRTFRALNHFVSIETPWPEALQHIATDGKVPIVIDNVSELGFTDQHLSVRISSPELPHIDEGDNYRPRKFLILSDDLTKFTNMWYYSNLTHLRLNSYLAVNLHLRAPYAADHDEKVVPKKIQQKLLLPFIRVKGLRGFTVSGDPKPYASVLKQLKDEQEQPEPTPEECLQNATSFKDRGDEALFKNGQCEEALRLYTEAWKAMHIIVDGRVRNVYADAFFDCELRGGVFDRKYGQRVRLVLRIQLVANTVLAYNKMEGMFFSSFLFSFSFSFSLPSEQTYIFDPLFCKGALAFIR